MVVVNMADEEPRKCVVCGSKMSDSDIRCPMCHSVQKLKRCVVCKKAIPKGANYCNDCKSYQGLRRYLPISSTVPALLVAILAVLTTAVVPLISYYNERNSHTLFKVTGADTNHVIVRVWNTGRKPSTLIGYRLKSDRVPGKEFMLDLQGEDKQNARNVIVQGQIVKLTNPAMDMIPTAQRGKQFTKDDWTTLSGNGSLSDVTLTLEIDIQESDDMEEQGKFRTRPDQFTADRIGEFIKQIRP